METVKTKHVYALFMLWLPKTLFNTIITCLLVYGIVELDKIYIYYYYKYTRSIEKKTASK